MFLSKTIYSMFRYSNNLLVVKNFIKSGETWNFLIFVMFADLEKFAFPSLKKIFILNQRKNYNSIEVNEKGFYENQVRWLQCRPTYRLRLLWKKQSFKEISLISFSRVEWNQWFQENTVHGKVPVKTQTRLREMIQW